MVNYIISILYTRTYARTRVKKQLHFLIFWTPLKTSNFINTLKFPLQAIILLSVVTCTTPNHKTQYSENLTPNLRSYKQLNNKLTTHNTITRTVTKQ